MSLGSFVKVRLSTRKFGFIMKVTVVTFVKVLLLRVFSSALKGPDHFIYYLLLVSL